MISNFKPLNPWGRAMPKPPRAVRERAPMADLYQVNVETRDGGLLPIGPRLEKPAAEMLCIAIGNEIAAGREKFWTNPHVLQVASKALN